MSDFLVIFLFAMIGGSIGWVTNKVAIYFLFNPKNPKKFLFWTVQGIFPKRQNAIAKRFSEIFVQEFFTPEMIHNQLFSQKNLEKIYHLIDDKIDEFLETNVKESYPLISIFIRDKHTQKIKDEILKVITYQVVDFTSNFESNLMKVIDIQQVIEEKIANLDSDKINNVMNKILNKELRFIELSGLILGALIGLIQGIIAINM